MTKLLLALPLPGAGALTLTRYLNGATGVQAICIYELMIDEIAEEFGISREAIRPFIHTPSDRLSMFHAGGETRAKLHPKYRDLFQPRTLAFYIENYIGPLRNDEKRAAAMLAKVRDTANSLVFFDLPNARPNIVVFQRYAEATGREFVLLELVRPGISALAARRFKYEGATLVENPEARPYAAARAIAELAT